MSKKTLNTNKFLKIFLKGYYMSNIISEKKMRIYGNYNNKIIMLQYIKQNSS